MAIGMAMAWLLIHPSEGCNKASHPRRSGYWWPSTPQRGGARWL